VITTAELTEAGLDRNQIRSLHRAGHLLPVLRGAWCTAQPGPRQQAIAAALVCHPAAIASHESAALLLRWREGWPGESAHLWLPPDATRGQERAGVRLHWGVVPDDAVMTVDGVAVTTGPRLARDTVRMRARDAAIALLDQGLHSGQLTVQELADLAPALPARRRSWLALTNGLSESPLESHVRLLLHDAGLHPSLQVVVRFPHGRHAGRIDMGWPDSRIGIECDGEGPHGEPAALYRDRVRSDDLASLGWHILRVTWRDLRTDRASAIARVHRARALRQVA
jgi:hypothetical protein